MPHRPAANLSDRAVSLAQVLSKWADGTPDAILEQKLARSTRVLELKPDTLLQRIADLAQVLNVSRAQMLRMVRQNPSMLLNSPDHIAHNLSATAHHFGMSPGILIRRLRGDPTLLLLTTETVIGKITALANALKISPDACISVVAHAPRLLVRSPETLLEKLQAIGDIFGCDLAPSGVLAMR